MIKPAAGRQMATAESFMAAGNQARELRAQLAKSFLCCETIAQEMRAIRANLTLPTGHQTPLSPADRIDDDNAVTHNPAAE